MDRDKTYARGYEKRNQSYRASKKEDKRKKEENNTY